MELKEKQKIVQEYRLIDDVFFEVFAEDIPACQEILRTILEDDSLVVHDVIVQSSKRNLYGRSVRLDALCTLGNGSKCNIEVQRSNKDSHLRRARFNASSITVKESNTGEKFEKVLELYIVYVTEFDFLKGNSTIYHIDKTVRETGEVIDDGLHEIFVNTAINDGSRVADLMSLFTSKKINSDTFPAITKRFNELKSEGGASAVCEIMEKYLKEEREETIKKERIKTVQNLIKKGCSKEFILDLEYSEEEYHEAEATRKQSTLK